jgi:hypothetical protein
VVGLTVARVAAGWYGMIEARYDDDDDRVFMMMMMYV